MVQHKVLQIEQLITLVFKFSIYFIFLQIIVYMQVKNSIE